MALFSFFKLEKPGGFTYHPRFYDEKKEKFRERLRNAEEMSGDSPEAMKARIRHNLQRKSTYLADRSYRTKQMQRRNLLLFVLIAALSLLAWYAIEVYLPSLMEKFEN